VRLRLDDGQYRWYFVQWTSAGRRSISSMREAAFAHYQVGEERYARSEV
jgi:hypothetical protein